MDPPAGCNYCKDQKPIDGRGCSLHFSGLLYDNRFAQHIPQAPQQAPRPLTDRRAERVRNLLAELVAGLASFLGEAAPKTLRGDSGETSRCDQHHGGQHCPAPRITGTFTAFHRCAVIVALPGWYPPARMLSAWHDSVLHHSGLASTAASSETSAAPAILQGKPVAHASAHGPTHTHTSGCLPAVESTT